MKDISHNNDIESYKLHFFETINDNPNTLLWLLDDDFNVIFSNDFYRSNFREISDGDKIVVISNHEMEFYPAKSYMDSLYTRALNGETLKVIFRLPNEHWIKAWIYPGQKELSPVVGFGADVTTEMESRLSLVKSEQKFRNIFETLQDIYFRCKIDGELLMISPSVEKITGYRSEELIGKDITNYYLYSVTTKKLLRRLTKERVLKNMEASLIHKSGRIIPSICTFRLFYDNGWTIEGNVRDIAEIKQVNEELKNAIDLAERSLKVKEKFLANMSHEIRTPLNGIIGMVNVLERTKLNIEQIDQVNSIKQSSDILLNLLNNLLDWSKLEAGKMAVQLNPVSPRQLLEKVKLLYLQKAQENKIILSTSFDKKLPEYFLSDEIKLIQIISNLISNAIKFTPEGGSIIVRLILLKKMNGYVKIKCEVEDTGLGIKEEETKILFESFTQLDNSENKRHEGAGLGLSISKELVGLLGGKIAVDSKPGKGSNFWFTIKGEITESKNATLSNIITINDQDYQPKILVIDDNKINLEVASQILKKAGGDVRKASSGKEAMNLVQQERYDVILLDIQMPDLNGIEVLERIHKELIEIPPVIALTAYNSELEKQKYLSLGFDAFVGKPFNPEELLIKVKELTNFREQVINQKVLNKLVHYGGAEMVKEALNDFCEDTEKLIKECFVSLSSQNHRRILNNLHTIKGNAGTLGVNKVSRCARRIEESIKQGHILKLKEGLAHLKQFFEEFKALYLEQY